MDMNGHKSKSFEGTVLFYDGDCGFCNEAVQFVMRHERNKMIRFSPFQSAYADVLFRRHGIVNDLRSMIVLGDGRFLKKSEAVIALAPFLKKPYRILLKGMAVFPRFLRNFVYDIVARNRKKIVRTPSCVLPPPEDRVRFL